MADAKHRGFLDPKAPPSDSGSNPAQRIEDDPLVELARIVSESAANLSRLGAQPGEEPTLILGRATPRPVPVRGDLQPSPASPPAKSPVTSGNPPQSATIRPLSPPASAAAPRAPIFPSPVAPNAAPPPAPSAGDDHKPPRISEDDLMASLRQSIEPGRASAEAKPRAAALDDEDDAPTVALNLRGRTPAPSAPAPSAAPAPAGNPSSVPIEESFDDLLFDLNDKADQGNAKLPPDLEPKADRPRLGDNFPRPPLDPQAKTGKPAQAPTARPKVTPPTQPRGSQRSKSSDGSGRGLFFAGSALAVVVLAGLGFLGYRAFAPVVDPTAVPVIKAAGEVKEKPVKQQVASVDSGATKLSADRVEDKSNLITKSEEPVEQVSLVPRKITPGAPGTVVPQPPSATDQPRTVKTVVVRPDGTIIQQAAVPPAQVAVKTQPIAPLDAAPAPLPQASVPPADPAPVKDPVGQLAALPPAPAVATPKEPPPAPPQPTLAAKTVLPQNNAAGGAIAPKLAPQPAPAKIGQPVGAPLALAPQAQPPQALQPLPRVALANPPAAVAPAPVIPAAQSGGGGDFMVQLSAQDSEDAARRAFASAQAKHGALAGRSPDVQRATVNGRTVFRVRVAAGSQEQAAGLCSQIKATGGDCFVAKR